MPTIFRLADDPPTICRPVEDLPTTCRRYLDDMPTRRRFIAIYRRSFDDVPMICRRSQTSSRGTPPQPTLLQSHTAPDIHYPRACRLAKVDSHRWRGALFHRPDPARSERMPEVGNLPNSARPEHSIYPRWPEERNTAIIRRFVDDIPTIFNRLADDILTICQRFADGLPAICKRFSYELPAPFRRFLHDLPTSLPRFVNDPPTIYR